MADKRERLNQLRRLKELRDKRSGIVAPSAQGQKGQGVEASNADFDFSKMAGNIPSSAGQLIKDVTYPVMHPLDTNQAIGNLIAGGVQKLIPGEQEKERHVDALVEGLKGRLGSWDAIKQTLQNDPVGLASDAYGLLTGGAGLVMKGARRGSQLLPKDLPMNELESVMKFKTTLPQAKVAKLLRTQLDDQVLPTGKGVKQLKGSINEGAELVDYLIDQASSTGEKVPVRTVFKHMDELKKELGGFKVNASDDLARVDASIDRFKVYLEKNEIKEVSLNELQAFKKDAWARTKFDTEPGQASYVNEKVKRSFGNAAKERLEKIDPKIKKENQLLGARLELLPELERSTRRIGNRNFGGLDLPQKIQAGGSAGGKLGAIAGGLAALARRPMPKARMAMLIHRLRKQGASAQTRAITDKALREQALIQSLVQSGRAGQNEEVR